MLRLFTIVLTLLAYLISSTLGGGATLDQGLPDRQANFSQGSYGTSSSPDFSVTFSTSFLSVGRGSYGVVGVTVSGTNGFSDTVALSLNISPNPGTSTTDCITADIDPNVVNLSPQQAMASVAVTLFAFEPRLGCYPPLGTYTVIVFGLAQTPPLSSREDRLTLAIQSIERQGAYLLFEFGYRGLPYAGAAVQLVSNFTNIGSVQVRVTWLNIRADFGSFNQTSGLPLDLGLGQKKTLTMTISIPSAIAAGDHGVSAVASWQWLNMSSWVNGGPITINGTIPVTEPFGPRSVFQILGNLGNVLFAGLVAYLTITVLAVTLVIRSDRRKQRALAKRSALPG